MNFKEELRNYQNIVNNELENYIRNESCPEEILNKSMEYSLMAGGKRIRPILAIATYKLFKENYEQVMPFAIALEMVHNFSLIHDDLPGIDNDDFRHGKPTNHKQFNEATAILAGDGLLNNAYMVISENLQNTLQKYHNRLENTFNISNDNSEQKQAFNLLLNKGINNEENELIELNNKLKVFNEFSNAIDRMIAGEYVDTELEGKQISKELLDYIHKNKTGAFLKYSVRMGAILANANDDELSKLTKYAENIGLAFQIKDDILSEEGDEKVLGKPVGNDKQHGKCTYVSTFGLEKSKEILNQITNEAIEQIKDFNNSEFLQELALYIANRNK